MVIENKKEWLSDEEIGEILISTKMLKMFMPVLEMTKEYGDIDKIRSGLELGISLLGDQLGNSKLSPRIKKKIKEVLTKG